LETLTTLTPAEAGNSSRSTGRMGIDASKPAEPSQSQGRVVYTILSSPEWQKVAEE
jgi:hypothetical protein